MSLCTRVIPTLLLKDGRMVKTIKFGQTREIGNPVTQARIYDAQDIDELLFLDINAKDGIAQKTLDVLDKVSEELFIPLTFGGGIRSLQDIETLLKHGADKVSIRTMASPCFVTEAARRFGSQCIVCCLDIREDEGWYTTLGNLDPITWVQILVESGAGEILIQSVDRDGTMQGYDLILIDRISKAASNTPVIALGGAGKLEHFEEAIKAGAHAVAAGSIFAFTDQSPIKARAYLKEAGLSVRHI